MLSSGESVSEFAAARSITCEENTVTKDIVSALMPITGWLNLNFRYLYYPPHSVAVTVRAIGRIDDYVWLKFRLQSSGKGNQVVTYGAGFCDGIFERDVGNLCAPKHDETAEVSLVHQIDCS